MGQKVKGTGPLKDSRPIKCQRSSSSRKYTTSKFPPNIKGEGGLYSVSGSWNHWKFRAGLELRDKYCFA